MKQKKTGILGVRTKLRAF